jgi:hypothetical protein
MSATKNSPAFDAMMEEARHSEDLQYDKYLSEQYFRTRTKGDLSNCDPGDEQPVNPPKGTTPKNNVD